MGDPLHVLVMIPAGEYSLPSNKGFALFTFQQKKIMAAISEGKLY